MVSDDGGCSQKFFTGNHPFVIFFLNTYKKWEKSGIRNYLIDISGSRFSPTFSRKVIFKMVIKKIKKE